MAFVNDLLNKISDFKCEVDSENVAFPGVLQQEDKNIILNAKFPIEQYRRIALESEFVVLGNISSKHVSLMGCHIKTASCSYSDNYISVFIVPNEIIVGGCFSSSPLIKRIVVSIPELNYMFSGESPLEPNIGISKENPGVLNYTFPRPIVANDKYGEIQLYRAFGFQWSADGYKYNIIPIIEYSFNVPMPLMDAVAKVSMARSLFAFFGNGYIPFGDITFEIDDEKNRYSLWLNYEEDIPAVNEPFLIKTSAFENQFQKVWESWVDFYEEATPIPTLFYEIVCNRSTKINSFLNLSQAIEVYSRVNKQRNARTKEIAKNDPNNTSKNTKLLHRYQDILSTYNNIFEVLESNIIRYSQGLSRMRNYYTHYNSKSYVEPTYDELFSAARILRFVLLTIIYTAVGISPDCILECKKTVIFCTFDNDIEAIFKYSTKEKEEPRQN